MLYISVMFQCLVVFVLAVCIPARGDCISQQALRTWHNTGNMAKISVLVFDLFTYSGVSICCPLDLNDTIAEITSILTCFHPQSNLLLQHSPPNMMFSVAVDRNVACQKVSGAHVCHLECCSIHIKGWCKTLVVMNLNHQIFSSSDLYVNWTTCLGVRR